MIAGIGIDITEIERVKTAAQKHPQFITKVLTPAEQQQLAALTGQRYWEYLSSRFSLKESFAKRLARESVRKLIFKMSVSSIMN